jgi:hypothetical protein
MGSHTGLVKDKLVPNETSESSETLLLRYLVIKAGRDGMMMMNDRNAVDPELFALPRDPESTSRFLG